MRLLMSCCTRDGRIVRRAGTSVVRGESGGSVMAKDHGSSVKDDKTYEALRDEGASREKAARIANAKAGGGKPSQKGGKSSKYEDQTKDQLLKKAADVGIEGRSKMDKDELVDALRHH
jgi:hypothetical protein